MFFAIFSAHQRINSVESQSLMVQKKKRVGDITSIFKSFIILYDNKFSFFYPFATCSQYRKVFVNYTVCVELVVLELNRLRQKCGKGADGRFKMYTKYKCNLIIDF